MEPPSTQGLGFRTGRHLLVWMAFERPCLGRASAVSRLARMSRSARGWQGNNMDQYADDLAELMNHLDLEGATMVGHSTGGGEVVRYLAPWAEARLQSHSHRRVPPLMLKTEKNPGGLPLSVFGDIRRRQGRSRICVCGPNLSRFPSPSRSTIKPFINITGKIRQSIVDREAPIALPCMVNAGAETISTRDRSIREMHPRALHSIADITSIVKPFTARQMSNRFKLQCCTYDPLLRLHVA